MDTNSSKGVFLDVDPSIIENTLCFASDPHEEELSQMLSPLQQIPSKLVKPFPGFCIKTREVGSEIKFFVNICHTDAIPPPKDITEQQLIELLESNATPDFRVPMSIGEIHAENDKKGEEAKITDVAIHPTFFKKIEQSQLFKNFFITIVFEGLKDKYGIVCHDDKIILKNRKAFGTLQMHRIQQRQIKETKSENRSVITEIDEDAKSLKTPPLIETISSEGVINRIPEYRLFRRKNQANCLIGEFKFPDINGVKELQVDVGEDRIVIESPTKHYLLDVFVPFVIRQNTCTSTFNKTLKILTVTMPLIGG